MSAKFIRFLAAFLFSIPVLIIFILVAQLWIFDYEIWVDYLLKIAGKKDWEKYFKVEIFSQQRFILLRYSSLILTGLTIFLSIFLFKRRMFLLKILINDIVLINKGIKSSFRALNKTEFALLLFVFLFFVCRAIVTIVNTELQYDEAWTFVHFSSKGFLVSAISPNNNHQFYSIFSAFLWKLDIDGKFAVRLPALFFSFFSLLALFVFTNKVFGKKISIIVVAILSVSIPFYFFSVLGRGYAPMLLFTILSSFSLLKIENDSILNNFLLRVFVASSVFGFYSNPAFLFVWLLSLLVFSLLNFNKKLWFDFVKANLILLLIPLLLMMPMILAGGFSVLGAAANKNLETGNFLLYLHRLADWLFLGIKLNIFFTVFGLSILCFFINLKLFDFVKHRKIFLLQVYWFWPFLIFITSGIESPYRIWFWMPVFFWLHFTIIMCSIKLNSLIIKTVFIAVTILNLYFSQKHYFVNWSLILDKESKKIAQFILEERAGAIECYSFSRYDKPLLEYYFLIHNRSFKTFMPFIESKNYLPFEYKKFDAVLLDTDEYKASEKELNILEKDYELHYINNRIKLYLNKDR